LFGYLAAPGVTAFPGSDGVALRPRPNSMNFIPYPGDPVMKSFLLALLRSLGSLAA